MLTLGSVFTLCVGLVPTGKLQSVHVSLRAPQLPVLHIAASAVVERPLAEDEEYEECPTQEATSLELVSFVIPTLSAALSSEIMSVVDTAVVGSTSSADLAALGPATLLTDSSSYLFFWLSVATTSRFASRLADGRADAAYGELSDALYIGVGCGVFLAVVLALSGNAALRSICWQAPSLVPTAQRYLSIRLLGLPAFMAGWVLQAACLAAKDSTSPLYVLLLAGALNLALDIHLVRNVGLGISGAAIATLASQLVQVALLAFVLQRKRKQMGSGSSWLLVGKPPSPTRFVGFLTFAGPIFLVLIGKVLCYSSMTLAATSGGVVALAAHQVMASVFFFAAKFGDAVSQTAQAFLPPCIAQQGEIVEANDSELPPEAQRLSRRLLLLSTFLGAFVSLLTFGFITRCSCIFTTDVAVTAAILSASPLLFVALLAHASCMCCEGTLMGARELPYLARTYAFNVFIFLSAIYFIARRVAGLNAVWCALAVFQYVRLVQFFSRSRHLGLLRGS